MCGALLLRKLLKPSSYSIFSGLEITESVLKRLDLVKQMNCMNDSRTKQFFFVRNVLFSSEIDLYVFRSNNLRGKYRDKRRKVFRTEFDISEYEVRLVHFIIVNQ